MKSLFYKSLLVATCLVVSTPAFATPVVDGFLGINEYSNSFTAGWYNWHNPAGSQYTEADNLTTTVYYEISGDNFFLYLAAPLEAKNMIWGNGFTEDDVEALSYYQHWCSPPEGETAETAGGKGNNNCQHHKDGFDTFKSNKTDFSTMTGSEKVGLGNGVEGNLAGNAKGTFYGTIIEYADSYTYVTNSPLFDCDTTNCNASGIPMAFEFMFDDASKINSLISYLTNNDIDFHLSPERGAAPVPEPSTLLLLGSGLLGMVFWRRKQGLKQG